MEKYILNFYFCHLIPDRIIAKRNERLKSESLLDKKKRYKERYLKIGVTGIKRERDPDVQDKS
jgi:hypothetical protein